MPTPIPIIFQFLSILPELNRRRRFGRPGSYPLDQGCIYISTAIPSTAIQTAYTKNSYTDIVLRAAAFCARIRRRQMRHILAFSQVTFAETCCLAGNCISLVYPYAEPISPRSDYRRITGFIVDIFDEGFVHFFCFSARADNRSRTDNLIITSDAHCQLCYASKSDSGGIRTLHYRRERAMSLTVRPRSQNVRCRV